MRDNITNVVANHANLSVFLCYFLEHSRNCCFVFVFLLFQDLENRSDSLRTAASMFDKNAREAERKMKRRNVKKLLLFVGLIAVLLLILIYSFS